ncbi:hypothetical protein V1502_11245 [Bacillus sp. SCS-153A]|uniref:hypothetical protein n=1 Tax=Rossellomorea sedimentorum TaxID=3115294 RepID=UPI003906A165
MRKKTLITIILLIFIIAACSIEEHLSFTNLEEAEKEIGELKIPDMPEGFKVTKITHKNDDFTHPVTKVFYKKGEKEITYMIASSWFDDSPSEEVTSDKIADISWITLKNEYVLKWRKTKQDSYKYLFTTDLSDKGMLISLAESF